MKWNKMKNLTLVLFGLLCVTNLCHAQSNLYSERSQRVDRYQQARNDYFLSRYGAIPYGNNPNTRTYIDNRYRVNPNSPTYVDRRYHTRFGVILPPRNLYAPRVYRRPVRPQRQQPVVIQVEVQEPKQYRSRTKYNHPTLTKPRRHGCN